MNKGVSKALECVDKCESSDDIRKCFINCYLNDRVSEPLSWIEELNVIVRKVIESYDLAKITFSKEFTSFIENPVQHLIKKLFIYTHDYRNGRLNREDYAKKAMMVINTSLRTNMRLTYQNWCMLTLIKQLGDIGGSLVYPEHNVLNLERSGKQRLRTIPPNFIINIPNKGDLSFYIEAPRPIAWEDTSDLKKTWNLYTALRPDLMIYGGRVYDIVNVSSNPPVLKPDLIIEIKELSDWYNRTRDVKGPLAKPLTAEEWRNRWIEGLWSNLAEVLGARRREYSKKIVLRGLRIREVKIVELYRSIYSPRSMILVSKEKIPDDVRFELESHNIEVVHGVGFREELLKPVVNRMLDYAKETGEYVIRIYDKELAELIIKLKELWENKLIELNAIKKLLESSENYISST
ncbi:MAG: hypothetical protein QXP72_05660 [Desulfurococcaceae archaeon]